MKTVMAGFTSVAMLATLAVFCAPQAHATLEIKISDGNGHSVDIMDGAAGDSCGTVGIPNSCVTFNGSLGDWNINVDTGTDGTASSPNSMDLNFNAHHGTTNAAGDTLTIQLSDIGFTPAPTGLSDAIGGTATGGGTVTASLFGGKSNTIFDESNPVGTTLTFTTLSFAGTDGGNIIGGVSPYSITQVMTISFGAAVGQATGDFAVSVPEPASVALLGGILLLTVGAIRRKTRRA